MGLRSLLSLTHPLAQPRRLALVVRPRSQFALLPLPFSPHPRFVPPSSPLHDLPPRTRQLSPPVVALHITFVLSKVTMVYEINCR